MSTSSFVPGAQRDTLDVTRVGNYTTTTRDALTGVGAGSLIFNTTQSKVNTYNGATWDVASTASVTSQIYQQRGGPLISTAWTAANPFGGSSAKNTLSADGLYMAVASSLTGNQALFIFHRATGSGWIDQFRFAGYCRSAALSSDGTYCAVGNGLAGTVGFANVFIRSGTTWTQQGGSLVGSGNTGNSGQGGSVAINATGDIIAVGGNADNGNIGAAWIWYRVGTTWTQLTKLVPNDNSGIASFGINTVFDALGTTLIVGGSSDNSANGAIWSFTSTGSGGSAVWTQQSTKLVPVGPGSYGFGTAGQIALSSDAQILAVSSINGGVIGEGEVDTYHRIANVGAGIWAFDAQILLTITDYNSGTDGYPAFGKSLA